MSTKGQIVKEQNLEKKNAERNTTVWILQMINLGDCTRDDQDTASLFRAAQNNAIRTNYIKARIEDKRGKRKW